MNKIFAAAVIVFSLTLPLSFSSQAEQITVPVGTRTQNATMELPQNGQTKKEVWDQFGEPVVINPSVGEPPISSWEYSAFKVFFENNLVLHTVVTKKTAQ